MKAAMPSRPTFFRPLASSKRKEVTNRAPRSIVRSWPEPVEVGIRGG
jgi:hypothetical protein